MFISFIHDGRIFQTNHRGADGTPLLVGIEDRLRNPMGTIRLEDVGVVVAVAATLRNFRPPHHYRVFGTKSGRCCDRSSLSGPSSPPRFFKKPRNSSSLQSKIQVGTSFPRFGMSAKNFLQVGVQKVMSPRQIKSRGYSVTHIPTSLRTPSSRSRKASKKLTLRI